MSRRNHAQRYTAIAVAFVATLTLGDATGRAADEASQSRVIGSPGISADSSMSAEAMFLRGQDEQVLVSRKHITPWQIRLQPDTAWLISPYLIERSNHGRWSTLNA